MVAVTLEGICKSFGSHEVLRDISLQIADKAFVAFVGPSGCGKSTLLRVIAGLEAVNAGDVRFGSDRVNDVPAPDRGAAMVFQSYALYPHMTVWENMSFSLRLQGIGRAERQRNAATVAKSLQMEDLLDRKPGQLSGGQRQRVAIGRALMRQPDVFLFDEPLSNLDAALRAEMRVELTRLHQSIGSTMIYVTHDQVEAMTMADQIVVLNEGRVMQVGTPMELYARPSSIFVAGFIGAPKINLLEAAVEGKDDGQTHLRLTDTIVVTLPLYPIAAGSRATLGIRPEIFTIGRQVPDSSRHVLLATVDVVELLGAEAVVYCRIDRLPDPVRIKVEGTTALKPGMTVSLTIDPAACHLFDGDGKRVEPGTGHD